MKIKINAYLEEEIVSTVIQKGFGSFSTGVKVLLNELYRSYPEKPLPQVIHENKPAGKVVSNKKVPKNTEGKSVAVINKYCEMFEKRYKSKPTIAAKERALACKIVDKAGNEKALEGVVNYLKSNDDYYCKMIHPLHLLLKDFDKIMIEKEKYKNSSMDIEEDLRILLENTKPWWVK